MASYHKLIFNADDDRVFPYLQKRGIDEAHLEKGRQLYKLVDDLFQGKSMAYYSKSSVDDAWEDIQVAAKAKLNELREVALMIGNQYPRDVESLGVTKPPPSRIGNWISYARDLYTKVLARPEYIAIMAKRGVPKAEIEAALAQVERMPDVRTAASKGKGAAEQTTLDRDLELMKLKEYCADLAGWARIALKPKPQLLEILGITVKRVSRRRSQPGSTPDTEQ